MENIVLTSNLEVSVVEQLSYAQLTQYSKDLAESITDLESMIDMANQINDKSSADKYSKSLMYAKNNKSTIDYCISKKESDVKSDDGTFLN